MKFNELLEILKREDDYFSLVRIMAVIVLLFIMLIYALAFAFGKSLPNFEALLTFETGLVTATLVSKYEDIIKEREDKK